MTAAGKLVGRLGFRADERLIAVARQSSPGYAVGGYAVRNASPAQRNLPDVRIHQHKAGNHVPTLFVCASNASAADIGAADYVCDGTADEAEINAALAATDGIVTLSAGDFNIAGDITGSGSPMGAGPATVLHLASQTVNIVVGIDYGFAAFFQVDITGYASTGIALAPNGDYFTLWGVSVVGAGEGTAFALSDTGQRAIGCSADGVEVGWAMPSAVEAQVVDCHGRAYTFATVDGVRALVMGCTSHGFDDVAPGIDVTVNGTDARIIGNYLESHLQSIKLAAPAYVKNNHLRNFAQEGILVDASCSVLGNDLSVSQTSAADNTYDQIRLTSNADESMVQANRCRANLSSSPRPRYGLRIDSGCSDAFVTNNDLKGSGQTGAFSDAGTSTITTAGNRT